MEPPEFSPNPYTPASSQLFYGREELMRKLLSDEQAGQSIVLLGGRRCGKTTLLRRLDVVLRGIALATQPVSEIWRRVVPDAAVDPPQRTLPVHWPVEVNFMGVHLNDYRSVLRHLAWSVGNCIACLGDGPQRPDDNQLDTTALESWLQDVDTWLSKRCLGGIALLIDEIEAIFHHEWHHDLMAFLRRLDDSTFRTRLWIVLVGANRLDTYISPRDGSPPLNTIRRVRLADLDYRTRRRMAIEPFTQRGRLPPNDATLITLDALAAGNVWLLTLLLEQLFAVDTPSPAVLDAAIQEVVEAQLDVVQRWARPMDDTGWHLYEQIASRGIVDSHLFRNDGQRSQRSLFEYQALVHRRQDGRIELGPDLFRRWAEDNGRIQSTGLAVQTREPEGDVAGPGRYRYDVALSYASPQREVARELADRLGQQGLAVFYDQQLGHELWGVDLNRHLPETYNRAARVAVLLLSADYVTRHWPQVEQKAAFNHAIRDGWDAILLVSVDGTTLPDVPTSVVMRYLNRDGTSIADIALELVARVRRRAD